MILISVVVTIYNVEKYISRCLDSILSQTYRNFELIIVNDGTPDNSMLIAEQYRHRDKRVRLVDYGNNVGLMCARRRGYLEANGDYVFFIDSDDTIPEDALKYLVSKAETTRPDIVAGQGQHYLCNGTSKQISFRLPYGNDRKGLYKALTHYAFPHYIWGKLIKKDLLLVHDYKYFDKLTNAEDYALIYQLAENVEKVETIDRVVYNYYQNLGSSTQVVLNHWQLECNAMVYSYILRKLEHYEWLRKDLYQSTQRALARFFAKGYDNDGHLTFLLKKYNVQDVLSIKYLLRYNSLFNAAVCIVGKSKLGVIIYNHIKTK